MKKGTISCMALLLAACTNNKTPTPDVLVKTEYITDTVTNTVEVPTIVDTAAIIAQYEAQHTKTRQTNKPATFKPHGKKMVRAVAHPQLTYPEKLKNAVAAKPVVITEQELIVVHDVDLVYYIPDEKASFPGGEKAFDAYIAKNLQYPEEALERGIEGTVWAEVFLDELGNVSKVSFPEARLGFGLNREAERILKNAPRWNPAKHNGKPVKSKFVIPITYEIK